MIVGRNADENRRLAELAPNLPTLQLAGGRGALTLVDGVLDDTALSAAAALAVRYSHAGPRGRVVIEVDGVLRASPVEVASARQEDLDRWIL